MKKAKVDRPSGVLTRYLAGGEWKNKIIAKLGKSKSEKCKMPKIYTAYPPPEGWPGGLPERNGCKNA